MWVAASQLSKHRFSFSSLVVPTVAKVSAAGSFGLVDCAKQQLATVMERMAAIRNPAAAANIFMPHLLHASSVARTVLLEAVLLVVITAILA
jgi:hypothetical protein